MTPCLSYGSTTSWLSSSAPDTRSVCYNVRQHQHVGVPVCCSLFGNPALSSSMPHSRTAPSTPQVYMNRTSCQMASIVAVFTSTPHGPEGCLTSPARSAILRTCAGCIGPEYMAHYLTYQAPKPYTYVLFINQFTSSAHFLPRTPHTCRTPPCAPPSIPYTTTSMTQLESTGIGRDGRCLHALQLPLRARPRARVLGPAPPGSTPAGQCQCCRRTGRRGARGSAARCCCAWGGCEVKPRCCGVWVSRKAGTWGCEAGTRKPDNCTVCTAPWVLAGLAHT